MRTLPWIRPFLALALAVVQVGCTAMVRDAARDVTPAVVSGAVEGLASPETQRDLVAAVDEGRVKLMAARMSAGLVDGVLDTLEDPKRKARLNAVLSGITATAAGAAVDSMMAHALDEKVQERMQLAMRATVAELITVGFETAGAQMGSSEDRTMAVGVAAHEIAKQATLGFQDALDQTKRQRESGTLPKGEGALLIAASDASQTGGRIVWTLGIGLAAVTLGLVIMLILAVRNSRIRRAELKQRDRSLSVLADAIESTAAQPGSDELRTVLESLKRDLAGAPRQHPRRTLSRRHHADDLSGPH